MQELREIKGHFDRVTHELIGIKKLIIGLEVKDKQKAVDVEIDRCCNRGKNASG